MPTQILAEAFRKHGYDGIVYKSLLDRDGCNIALFDLASAEWINCRLCRTETVALEFAQELNFDVNTKYYPEIVAGREAKSGEEAK